MTKKKKILLVEDEVNVVRLFSFVLEREGFEVDTAENGKIAFEKVKSFNPDLILSDIMMPIIDGFEFRRILLRDPATRQIPFVFLTAKGTEEDMLKGYDLEIQDYILKTSSPKIVIKKLNAIFANIQKEREKAEKEVQKAADSLGSTVVPKSPPKVKGFEIRQWHQPFENIPGGDFIDYYKTGEGSVVIAIGDVMGKKWGAWYFAVAYAGYVRSAVRMAIQSAVSFSPADILQRINKAVYEDERISEVFITLSILIIDNNKMELSYSGAGDLPIIHKNDSVTYLKSDGLLLGFKSNGDYSDVTAKLSSGDLIVLYSDGLTESRNPEGEAFGVGKFREALDSIPTGETPIEYIRKNFRDFTHDNFEDDVSLIVVTVL